jgi:uncharacterized protein with ParB-like and HNH nuclease domain
MEIAAVRRQASRPHDADEYKHIILGLRDFSAPDLIFQDKILFERLNNMEANPVRVIQYFDGTKQNVVPLFQRPYTWEKLHWSNLWDDILPQYDLGAIDSTHFMGAIVSVPAKTVPVGVNKHLIIDGQQRLTTIALLLCALRPFLEPKDRGRVEDYLINRHYDGPDRLKLMPTHGDREPYSKLVFDDELPPRGQKMRQAIDFFTTCIKGDDLNGTPIKPDLLLQTVERCLQVVMINLGDSDDPYLIFESLNYKGEPLTQADLVRNYVLMRFKNSLGSGGEQEQVYLKLWKPIQESLNDSLPEFLRHYAMKEGEEVKRGGIYAAVKKRLAAFKEPSEVENELRQMKRHGEFYREFIDPPAAKNPRVRNRLQALIDIDMTISYPLLLRLFDAHERKVIADSDLLDALATIESYLVRRFLCGLPSNALSRIFVQLAKYFQEENTASWLRNSLSSESSARRWPGDDEVKQAILYQSQYGRKATRYVLLAIERSFEHKEPIDLEQAAITIEHILPQTLNDEWQTMLGPKATEIHGRWVDTLGNLSLTGYNYELGNMAFSEKRKFFQESHLDLNRWIGEKNEWNEHTIAERAAMLTQHALALWPCPIEENEQGEDNGGSKKIDLSTGGWESNSAISDLYRRLSDGLWHSRSELESVVAGRADLDDRLGRIRRRGKHHSLWILEEKDGSFRLSYMAAAASGASNP